MLDHSLRQGGAWHGQASRMLRQFSSQLGAAAVALCVPLLIAGWKMHSFAAPASQQRTCPVAMTF